MNDNQRFAIVITHAGERCDIVEMPWLESEYQIDASDWMVLSNERWRSMVNGEPTIWDALQRKLLTGSSASAPRLIAVIGHPSIRNLCTPERRQAEVLQIVRSIRALQMPVHVIGIWADDRGGFQNILEPAGGDAREPEVLQSVQ